MHQCSDIVLLRIAAGSVVFLAFITYLFHPTTAPSFLPLLHEGLQYRRKTVAPYTRSLFSTPAQNIILLSYSSF